MVEIAVMPTMAMIGVVTVWDMLWERELIPPGIQWSSASKYGIKGSNHIGKLAGGAYCGHCIIEKRTT